MGNPISWVNRWVWFFAGILLASGFWLWQAQSRRTTAEEILSETAAAAPEGDVAEQPTSVSAPSPDCFVGVIKAEGEADVAAEVSGRIRDVRVRVGDLVEEGQILATISTDTLEINLGRERAALQEAETRLASLRIALDTARRNFGRQKQLTEEGVTSQEALERSRDELERAESEYKAYEFTVKQAENNTRSLETQVRRNRIRAPIAGRISQRYLNPGAQVSIGTRVVRLIGDSQQLAFAFPPQAADLLAVGTRVRVEAEHPREELTATVYQIAPELNLSSQMTFAEARFEVSEETSFPWPNRKMVKVSVASEDSTPLASCFDRAAS